MDWTGAVAWAPSFAWPTSSTTAEGAGAVQLSQLDPAESGWPNIRYWLLDRNAELANDDIVFARAIALMRSRNAANSAALTASVWLLTRVADRLLSRLATLSVTSLPARISPPLFETDAAVTSSAPPATIWPAVPSA